MATITNMLVSAAGDLMVGQSHQFAATAIFDDGSYQDVTAAALWNSSVPAVASVDASGLAEAEAEGDTTITATYLGIDGSTVLTVDPAPPPPPPVPTPCALLQQAYVQMGLLMSGQATAAIDTPQLGRVEFTQTTIGNLQRWIQMLAGQCIASGGTLPPGYTYQSRRPISIEALP